MLLIRVLQANIAQIKNDRNSVVIEELVDTDLSSKIEKSSFLLLLPIYYCPMQWWDEAQEEIRLLLFTRAHSSLRMAAFRAAFIAFKNKRPLAFNCLTYGTLYMGAEFSQQSMLRKVLVSVKITTQSKGQIGILTYVTFFLTILNFPHFLRGTTGDKKRVKFKIVSKKKCTISEF